MAERLLRLIEEKKGYFIDGTKIEVKPELVSGPYFYMEGYEETIEEFKYQLIIEFGENSYVVIDKNNVLNSAEIPYVFTKIPQNKYNEALKQLGEIE